MSSISTKTKNKKVTKAITNEHKENDDEFIMLKKSISIKIREVRAAIQERQNILDKPKYDQISVIRMSTMIRADLKELHQQSEELHLIVIQTSKFNSELGIEYEKMCKMIESVIDDIEKSFLGKNIATPNCSKQNDHQSPQTVSIVNGYELEDIDISNDEQLMEWQNQVNDSEIQIDRQLDQLDAAVQNIKHITNEITIENESMNEIVNNVDHIMDRNADKLYDSNEQLDEILEAKARRATCCIDIVLVLIIIGIVVYLIIRLI